MAKHKVGVIGVGFVGQAVVTGFETVLGDKVEVLEYDKYKDTESLQRVVDESDILFICLPTPMNEDGSCNTSIIEEVVQEIYEIADEKKLLVIKSTVPPGTTEKLSEKYPKLDFCFNPEFLTQANFINDFINQDRIIIGIAYGKTMKGSPYRKLEKLYEDFIENQNRNIAGGLAKTKYIECQPQEAEMLKYVTNTFLATKVSFFNEMYEICQKAEIDFENIREMLQDDERIGSSHTKVPGPDGQFGFSGACFPKDINALIAYARKIGVDPLVLDSIWTKNLLVREVRDWESLAQVNGKYKKA